MPLIHRLDDIARHELDAERRRHLAALTEGDGDPHAFLREFEIHLSLMTNTMQRLARRTVGAETAAADRDIAANERMRA